MTIGTKVSWVAQSAGSVVEKRGVIVEVVSAGDQPHNSIGGWSRNHKSYVVRATAIGPDGKPRAAKLYWPRVSVLREVDWPRGPRRDCEWWD